MKIILASASPRRRELMNLITSDFTPVSTNADESLPPDIKPELAAEFLSKIKADAAFKIYPDAIVIGCDTTVLCNGEILGKPHDTDECRRFMKMLSGKTHKVITGCSIIAAGKSVSFSVCTLVEFRALSDDEIEKHINTAEPYDKAGGYGIQGKGALLIEKINGDYFNVVGLPVSRLNTELKHFIKEYVQ
jgi:septum formation protein